MTPLDELLLFSGLTLVLMLVLGRFSYAGKVATVFYGGQLLFLAKMADRIADGAIVTFSLQVELFGLQMSWRFDALSWFLQLSLWAQAFSAAGTPAVSGESVFAGVAAISGCCMLPWQRMSFPC